ncbi:MAG: hypothetical protein C4526_03530 [Nitrospiraceae bacterium]|nr:MAG: hypothetical protein C4526_03530 [Nitrospiraceae bacterium]
MSVNVTKTKQECIVEFDINQPPDIFFDTNVWRGMNDDDKIFMDEVQQKMGFRYRYTVTNFLELVSHLADESSKKNLNPFNNFKACFRKIVELCHAEVLPSPEMDFMEEAGLSHYIAPSWIPDINLMINKVEAIANANSIEDLSQLIDVSHYTKLRQTDGESLRTAINNFPQISKPATSDDLEKALRWFMYIASFFLIERPSNGRIKYQDLAEKEKVSFQTSFISGTGRLFFNHCMTRIRLTIRDGKKVDPNDLYDMLQLILLRNRNRIFVTSDKSYFLYKINDPETHKVISWKQFRNARSE